MACMYIYDNPKKLVVTHLYQSSMFVLNSFTILHSTVALSPAFSSLVPGVDLTIGTFALRDACFTTEHYRLIAILVELERWWTAIRCRYSF